MSPGINVTRPRRRSMSPAVREVLRKAKLDSRAEAIGATVVTVPKRAKWNQVKANYNGAVYDSMGEAEFAHNLDLQLRARSIRFWCRPKPVIVLNAARARDRITYKPDFEIHNNDGFVYFVDYKGSKATHTYSFRMKLKMWAQTQRYELRVVFGDGTPTITVKGLAA